ncbi:recombinase RecT [Paenibacillus sp. NRS-1781]|uniref:recombinase RecT n=1 Tax=Paenibacillus sp. NRS-1781 TaxID=3233905 RepID=UPI003D2C3743
MANTKQLSTEINLNEIQAIGEFGLPELMTMKETLGKKLTIPQFNLFMYQMNRMKLDPSLKHAFPIPYGDTIDIRIAYEGYHAKAQESEGYQGVYNQVICENEVEDFEAETDDEGVIVSIKHKIRFPRGKVMGAYSIAKREGRKNAIVLMDVSEVQKWVKKNPNFWKLDDGSIDPDMFKKHAGTRAIKAQYDIAAVVEDSMESLNAGSAVPSYERRDITAESDAAAAAAKQDNKQLPSEEPPLTPVEQALADMKSKFKQLGITERDDQYAYIQKHAKPKADAPTLAELKGLLKIMDLHLAEKAAQEQANDELPL